jgi:hypothetical protein
MPGGWHLLAVIQQEIEDWEALLLLDDEAEDPQVRLCYRYALAGLLDDAAVIMGDVQHVLVTGSALVGRSSAPCP